MRLRPRFTAAILIVVCLAVGALIAGCGGGGGTGTSTQTETEAPASQGGGEAPASGANESAPSGEAPRAEKVEIVDYSYSPDPVRIQEGGKVIWMNQDSTPHTATADDGSFDTGTIEEGKLQSETFKEAGTFTYHCEIHPNMHGTVEVVESS